MSNTIPTAVVLRAVAKPPLLLGAAPDLTKLAGGVGIFTWLATLDGILAVFIFGAAQGAAMWLSYRDRYCVDVLRARFRCKRTRNLITRHGNRYVA
jgi:hypothetical protein